MKHDRVPSRTGGEGPLSEGGGRERGGGAEGRGRKSTPCEVAVARDFEVGAAGGGGRGGVVLVGRRGVGLRRTEDGEKSSLEDRKKKQPRLQHRRGS